MTHYFLNANKLIVTHYLKYSYTLIKKINDLCLSNARSLCACSHTIVREVPKAVHAKNICRVSSGNRNGHQSINCWHL